MSFLNSIEGRRINGPRKHEHRPLTKTREGWIAGLIDEEGAIELRYKKNTDSFSPCIEVGMTNKATISFLCYIIGTGSYHEEESKILNHNNRYRWVTSYTDVYYILRIIQSMLIVKKSQAELIQQFRQECGQVFSCKKMTSQQRNRAWEIKLMIHKLNEQGRNQCL